MIIYLIVGVPTSLFAAKTTGDEKNGKRMWTKDEMEVVFKAFQKHISGTTLPDKAECTKLIQLNGVSKNRTWGTVKDFVRNHKIKVSKKRKQ